MRNHLILLTGAALALSAAATGCESAEAGVQAGSTVVAPPACPARAPAQLAPRVQGPVRLVPTGPVVAAVCGYHDSRRNKSLISRFVLRGAAAGGLAAVADEAGRVTVFARHCDRAAARLPNVMTVFFGYRSRPSRLVTVSFTYCQLVVLTSGQHAATVSGPVQDDLLDLAVLKRDGRGDRTPDLIGLTPKAVTDRLKKAGFGFDASFDGVAIDQAAPFGTVIFASPPAGVRVGRSDNLIGVELGVHRAPVCTVRQLRLVYLGGGPNGGHEAGSIEVSDRSGRPCRLAGPVRITGLNAAGRAVTETVTSKVIAPSVLGPRVRVRRDQLPSSGTLADEVDLTAKIRYRPAQPVPVRPCAAHRQVVPARWKVTLPDGRSVEIANSDPGNPQKLVKSGGFVTCRGRFSLVRPVHYTGVG
jgi:hypothetical protein